jgi:hypothetical protein
MTRDLELGQNHEKGLSPNTSDSFAQIWRWYKQCIASSTALREVYANPRSGSPSKLDGTVS